MKRLAIATAFGVILLGLATPSYAIDDQNCSDFPFQEDAQAHLQADPTDPDGLDAEHDGIACEDLPHRSATTSPTANSQPVLAAEVACDPSYPDFCIPPPPPNLNCPDIAPQFSIHVLSPDPHGFDGDNDGIGCESNAPVTTAVSRTITAAAATRLPRTGVMSNQIAAAGLVALLLGGGCLYLARRRRSVRMP